jgi:hypothetical protein
LTEAPSGGKADGMDEAIQSEERAELIQRRLEMDSPAGYLHLGFIVISAPNLLLIGGMIVLFVIALLAPFPGNRRGRSPR